MICENLVFAKVFYFYYFFLNQGHIFLVYIMRASPKTRKSDYVPREKESFNILMFIWKMFLLIDM